MSKLKSLIISLFSVLLVGLIVGAFPIVSSAKGPGDVTGAYVDNGAKLVVIETDGYDLNGFDLTGYWISVQANNVTIQNCNTGRITFNPGFTGAVIKGNTISVSGDIGVNVNINNCTITGNNIGGGVTFGVVLDGVSGCTVSGNTVTGASQQGIFTSNASNCSITGNTINGNAGNSSIYADHSTSLTIDGNILNNSGHYGIVLNYDNGSIVNGNTLKDSAYQAVDGNHGDAVLLEYCSGSQVTNNIVDGVKSAVQDWGNGIIVGHENSNISVIGNEVKNVGNHGMQVSYGSATGIVVKNNTVTGSGNQGISISRAAAVDLIGNKVFNNVGNGIVFDGSGTYNGVTGVTGKIEGNECYSNTGSGIWAQYANITIKGNNSHNNATEGIRLEHSTNCSIENNTVSDNGADYGGIALWYSSATVAGNKVNLSSRKDSAMGIYVSDGSSATIKQNRIANYGASAVFAAGGSTVDVTDNQASVSGTSAFAQYTYYIQGTDVKGAHTHLWVNEFTNSKVKGQTFKPGNRSGAVVNGTVNEVLSDSKGYINVSFTAQSNTDKIVLFTIDKDTNNAIYINASKDFVLPGSGGRAEVEAFVERFYTQILDRPSEPAGLENWTNALVAGTRGGADVADEFIHSAEFQKKTMSDDEYITKLYHAFFNREPDAPGMASWKADLAAGKGRDFVLNGFLVSDEYKNLCANYGIKRDSTRTFVKRFYKIILGREDSKITAAELDNWQIALDAKAITGSQMAREWINDTPEFKKRTLTDEEYLNILYNVVLKRDIDPSGLATWSGELNKGRSRADILEELLRSNEFKEMCAEYGINP